MVEFPLDVGSNCSEVDNAMTPLWKAVYSLREAETLAGMGNVAGPADAPPSKPEEEDGWARDWLSRAKDALRRAQEMHTEAGRKGMTVLKERAHRIASKLRDGAAGVIAGAKNIVQATRSELDKFHTTAREAATAWASMNVLFTVAGIIAAVWYFSRR